MSDHADDDRFRALGAIGILLDVAQEGLEPLRRDQRPVDPDRDGPGVERITVLVRTVQGNLAAAKHLIAITTCATPSYHKTHRYCPSCPWAEDDPASQALLRRPATDSAP